MNDAAKPAWLKRNLTSRERERFETAEKIPQGEWKGEMLCVPPGDDSGLYFSELAEIADRFDGGEFPLFAWDCDPEPFVIAPVHVDGMLESALDDHHEGAKDWITPAMREELQGFLDGWAERTKIRTFHPNYKRAVMLTPPEEGGE